MQPITTPAALDPVTVDALTTVTAWGRAFNDRDLDSLLALAAPDIRLNNHRGVERGHNAVRRMLALQTYGVAQHIRPLRYLAHEQTVAVEALVELRWVDGGELAETAEAFAVFEARDGRVHSFSPQPDLPAACRIAGWPPDVVPPSQTRHASAPSEQTS